MTRSPSSRRLRGGTAAPNVLLDRRSAEILFSIVGERHIRQQCDGDEPTTLRKMEEHLATALWPAGLAAAGEEDRHESVDRGDPQDIDSGPS